MSKKPSYLSDCMSSSTLYSPFLFVNIHLDLMNFFISFSLDSKHQENINMVVQGLLYKDTFVILKKSEKGYLKSQHLPAFSFSNLRFIPELATCWTLDLHLGRCMFVCSQFFLSSHSLILSTSMFPVFPRCFHFYFSFLFQ